MKMANKVDFRKFLDPIQGLVLKRVSKFVIPKFRDTILVPKITKYGDLLYHAGKIPIVPSGMVQPPRLLIGPSISLLQGSYNAETRSSATEHPIANKSVITDAWTTSKQGNFLQ